MLKKILLVKILWEAVSQRGLPYLMFSFRPTKSIIGNLGLASLDVWCIWQVTLGLPLDALQKRQVK